MRSGKRRTCTQCGETKPLSGFRKYKYKDGTKPTAWCRSCLNAYSREHNKKPEVRERRRQRDWFRYHHTIKTNPVLLEKEQERKREYNGREDVKAALRERSKAWAQANPERVRSNQKRWKEENRDRARVYWRAYYQTPYGRMCHRLQQCKRRAAIKGSECTLTGKQWDAIHEAWGGRCAYCGTTVHITVDHVVPIMRGGAHASHNVVPACRSCNSRKSDRSAEEFLGGDYVEFLRRWRVATGRVALFLAA